MGERRPRTMLMGWARSGKKWLDTRMYFESKADRVCCWIGAAYRDM